LRIFRGRNGGVSRVKNWRIPKGNNFGKERRKGFTNPFNLLLSSRRRPLGAPVRKGALQGKLSWLRKSSRSKEKKRKRKTGKILPGQKEGEKNTDGRTFGKGRFGGHFHREKGGESLSPVP